MSSVDSTANSGFQAWLPAMTSLVSRDNLFNLFVASAILLIGTFLARRVRETIEKLPQLETQQRHLLSKLGYYGLLMAAVAAALSQVGIDVKVILGAAGILTVAVGFAAQTSASNLISGIFLMVEKPFVVGDVISIGDLRGEVLSIDLISSKIRTFNNLMVRIPNETMVKSNIVNFSYFRVRRVDLSFGLSAKTDLRQLESLLREAARVHPLSLEDPAPLFICNGFTLPNSPAGLPSVLSVQFQVFTISENMSILQNELYRDIKSALDQNAIALA